MAVITSMTAEKMNKREKGGAIINISSYSCVSPMPYMATYAATKGFNDVFSRSCSKEQKNIDILSVRAMKVISGKVKEKRSFTVVTSRECAQGSLKYLGKENVTAGALNH